MSEVPISLSSDGVKVDSEDALKGYLDYKKTPTPLETP